MIEQCDAMPVHATQRVRSTIRKLLHLEGLLLLSIVALFLQLGAPTFVRWWQQPRPGYLGILDMEDENDELQRSFASQAFIYLPEDYSGKREWPLAIFLHGSGGRGNALKIVERDMPVKAIVNCSENRAIVAIPQCRANTSWDPDEVKSLIETLGKRYQVNRDQVYLIGFSMGGYATWATAAKFPDLFAAIVPACGGGDPSKASRLTNLPIWAFHSKDDSTVSLRATAQMVEAIKQSGGHPKLTIFANNKHYINDDVCRNAKLWQWLLEQRRTVHPSGKDSTSSSEEP
jgi:predicted esterase